jgi:hypothetical protein
MPIDVTLSRHCQALPPSLSHRINASCTHPSLGGEAPALSITTKGVLRAGALPEAAVIAVTVRLSHLHVASLPSTVFTTTSE